MNDYTVLTKLFQKIEYGLLILGRNPDCFTSLSVTGPNWFPRISRAVALCTMQYGDKYNGRVHWGPKALFHQSF